MYPLHGRLNHSKSFDAKVDHMVDLGDSVGKSLRKVQSKKVSDA